VLALEWHRRDQPPVVAPQQSQLRRLPAPPEAFDLAPGGLAALQWRRHWLEQPRHRNARHKSAQRRA
jgi:hypothetical protein